MNRLLLQLLAVFLVTQALGLYVAVGYIQAIQAGNLERPAIVTDNPEDISNAVGLIAYILLFTAVILLVIRFFKGKFFFKLLELLAVFGTAVIVFSVFLPASLALAFALLLVALRLCFAENVLLRNASSIIAVAGVGATVGIALGIIPVLVFIVLLAAYDFIAVFKTKHMITMAKHITKQNLAFTIAMPSKKHRHQFELGTGDLVIPLAFAVSSMRASMQGFPLIFVPAVLILLGSLIGLLYTLHYTSRHVGKALPALPLQVALMVAFFAASKLLGF